MRTDVPKSRRYDMSTEAPKRPRKKTYENRGSEINTEEKTI
jgi:hypothetical protein